MHTAAVYYDTEGNQRTVHWMVRNEPGWAANRVKAGEDAIAELAATRAIVAGLLNAGSRLAFVADCFTDAESEVAAWHLAVRAALAKEGE